MNRQRIRISQGTKSVDGIANYVHYPSPDLASGRHRDRSLGILGFHPATQSVRGIHCDTPDGILPNMLLNFNNQWLPALSPVDQERIVDARQSLFIGIGTEVYIHYRTDDLRNITYAF